MIINKYMNNINDSIISKKQLNNVYDIFSKFTQIIILPGDKIILNNLIKQVNTKNITYETISDKYYIFLFILYSNLFVEYIPIELDILYTKKIIETILNTDIIYVIFNSILD